MQTEHDLQLSGLEKSDMNIRELGLSEKAACGVSPHFEGYVIPYYDIYGKPLPFYRCKLFNSDIKYKQLKSTSNHVYFPPGFWQCLKDSSQKYVIITEGEKKAAAAVKAGFPCCALGGVDSWRNRIILLPKETEISAYSYNKKLLGAKIPPGGFDTPGVVAEPIAVGFEELMSVAYKRNLTVFIAYDSDYDVTKNGVKFEVQRAASELGFEMRRRGIVLRRIRQLILPPVEGAEKTGLDDLLTLAGPKTLNKLIADNLTLRNAFPQHPNMVDVLNKKLQSPKLNRKDIQKLSLSVIADLDSRGCRMISRETDQLYYFENATKKLLHVDLALNDRVVHTNFSKLLYVTYGLATNADVRLMKWIATQYTGEDPIEEVKPYRMLARHSSGEQKPDRIRVQINDGQYAHIDSEGLRILDNGVDNILFVADQVEGVDAEELQEEFKKRQSESLEMWWEDVLQKVRLKDHGKTATLLSLLYYISPWLHRWRGTQLPAELVIGEPGSGKSTLCELRLQILTGRSNLKNAPNDLKDWNASISNTGGLHVADNIQLLDKNLRQRLSDEICRLITEPEPSIEMRKYYTEADLIKVNVDAVFAFTSITQPFTQADLLQRSIKVELDKLANDTAKEGKVSYDSRWKSRQIERFGGRTAWLSHHLHVLHKFFQHIEEHWDQQYQAKHRLINLEQCLVLLADMFGLESSWIPEYLTKATDSTVVEADWMFEGLVAFCEAVRKNATKVDSVLGLPEKQTKEGIYSAKNIADWCLMHEDYAECSVLTNSRRLGRYLSTNKAMIVQIAGLHEYGKVMNKTMYIVKDQ